MRLDLRDIIHIPGARKEFCYTLDLSGFTLYGETPFDRPVEVSGVVRNVAGALELTGQAVTRLDVRCDRCLKPVTVELDIPAETLLAEELANEEDEGSGDIVLLTNGGVELDEIFTPACVFALDGKHLCREDCKGLCPTCGKDLNEGPCACGKEMDPRLAVLAKLLDDKESSQDKDEEA